MASTTTKPAPKRNARKGSGSKSNGKGSQAAPKAKPASKRPTYSDEVLAITGKARKLACPVTLQGPVARQVSDIMRDVKDPRAAIKRAGLSLAQLKKLANGDGDAESKKALRTIAEQVNGAPQWTRGRPLAATLVAWLESK